MSQLSLEPVKQSTTVVDVWKFLIRDEKGIRELGISQRLQSFGKNADADVLLETKLKGILFSLLPTTSTMTFIRGHENIEINGERVRNESLSLKAGDLLQWKDGHAVLMKVALSDQKSHPAAHKVLELLTRYSTLIQERGAVERGNHLILDAFLKWSGAERAVLFNENSDGSGWQKLAEKSSDPRVQTSARELMSHTVLAEALKSGGPVIAENLLEHPWSKAHSLIGQRIFSLACIPLQVDGRTLGALFLFSHTPGKVINRDCLEDLALLAGQASVILATQNELIRLRKEKSSSKNSSGATPLKASPVYSKIYSELLQKVEKAAPSPLPILVSGETGSGKERIAKLIHEKSRISKGPFVALNCAAIPETLLESTLFGHEKGAFTGAIRSQPGRFQLADGGTLFLDEIADLSLPLQAKILRALQEGEIDPVGSSKSVKVNVRIVSATHQDLEKCVRERKFREDLYFRIKGVELKVPALRERVEDIEKICLEIMQLHGRSLTLSEVALYKLKAAAWPGNVRELKQVLEQALWLNSSGVIEAEDLQIVPRRASDTLDEVWASDSALSLKDAQEDFAHAHIQRVLESCGGRRNLAAEKLGISERTLYRMLAEIEAAEFGRGN